MEGKRSKKKVGKKKYHIELWTNVKSINTEEHLNNANQNIYT